jgi:MoxR-like ATPase
MSKGGSVTGNRMIVLSNPIEGEDDRFNKWYDEVHVPEVLDVPGVIAAQRYDLAELKIPDDPDLPAQLPPPTHRYLVIYELDRAPEDVMAGFLERVMSGKLSLGETLDLTTVSMTGWTPSGERRLPD